MDMKYKLEFGTKLDNCATITIDLVNEYGYLNGFGYNLRCALSDNNSKVSKKYELTHGDGTKEFFKAILMFIFQKYEHLVGIVFDDDSTITSKIKSRCYVELKYLYLCMYGKTWYEYHFSAHLMNLEKYIDHLENFNYIVTQPMTQSDFTVLKTKYFINNKDIEARSILERECQISITNGESMRTFVTRLHTSYDCYIFESWISRYVNDTLAYRDFKYMLWVIFKDSVVRHDNMLEIEYKHLSNLEKSVIVAETSDTTTDSSQYDSVGGYNDLMLNYRTLNRMWLNGSRDGWRIY
jgi:hypothetical protein